MSLSVANEDSHDFGDNNDPSTDHGSDVKPTSQSDQRKNVHVERIKAADDTQQVLVSTAEQGVYGTDVSLEAKGTQYIGQIDPLRFNNYHRIGREYSLAWKRILRKPVTKKALINMALVVD